MKILQINKFYYLAGGSERYFFELSDLLREKGNSVVSFSMVDKKNNPSADSRYFADNVDVRSFSLRDIFKSFWNYDAARKLKRLIKKEKPDIAHLHNIHSHLSLSIIPVLRKAGIPIVMTLHDYKFICPNRMLYCKNQICHKCRGHKYYQCFFNKCVQNSRAKSFLGMLEAYLNNRILKMADKIDLFIAPSQFIKDIFVDFGLSKEKIKVIHNFIQHLSEHPADVDVGTKKNNISSPQTFKVSGKGAGFLYFGRISEEKGIGTLIAAVNRLEDKINLKIAGSGPDYNKYINQVKALRLQKNIEFLGPQFGDKLKKLIANAKVIIIPSLWEENFPYTMLEAMASAKVIIASDIGGIPEMIKDEKTGFLFRPGDSNDLARKIGMVNNSRNLREIEKNALASVKKLNPDWHVKEIIDLYKGLK